MDQLLIVMLVVACSGAAIFGALLHKLSARPRTLPVTAEWIDDLSVERYRPMIRLLSEDDLRFASSHPGFTRRMVREFRAQRCQIVRGYLGWLRADFERICTAI